MNIGEFDNPLQDRSIRQEMLAEALSHKGYLTETSRTGFEPVLQP